MFPVQISVFISKVQVHLDHHEINVSKYNTSVERRRGESSEPWWKPELLQALLGVKAGPAATPHPDGAVRSKDVTPSFNRACAPPWWAALHPVPDRFAFCSRRDSESFHGQTPHSPLLPQLHLKIILNLFKHQRPHKLALKVSELPYLPPWMMLRPCNHNRAPPHITQTHGPCRRGHVSGDNLLFFKHSMHAASSSITSYTVKILLVWKILFQFLRTHSSAFLVQKEHFDSFFQSQASF